MSIRDLRNMGLLKPESEWSDRPPSSRVRGWAAMFWLLLAGAGCALMIIGGGGVWMWAGIVAFTVSLGGFVRLNIRSVDRSNSQ